MTMLTTLHAVALAVAAPTTLDCLLMADHDPLVTTCNDSQPQPDHARRPTS